MVDLFGLQKDSDPLFPDETVSPQPSDDAETALPDEGLPQGKHKLWAALLVVDAVLVVVFGGALAAKLYAHLKAPPPTAAPQVVRRKPAPEPPAPAPVVRAVAAKPAPPPMPAKPAPKAAAKTSSAAGKVHAVAVEFKLKAPRAKSVHLVGAFMVRDGGRKVMTYKGDGTWSLSLHLLPGTSYRYWFVVDGRKVVDPENPRLERGASVLALP